MNNILIFFWKAPLQSFCGPHLPQASVQISFISSCPKLHLLLSLLIHFVCLVTPNTFGSCLLTCPSPSTKMRTPWDQRLSFTAVSPWIKQRLVLKNNVLNEYMIYCLKIGHILGCLSSNFLTRFFFFCL